MNEFLLLFIEKFKEIELDLLEEQKIEVPFWFTQDSKLHAVALVYHQGLFEGATVSIKSDNLAWLSVDIAEAMKQFAQLKLGGPEVDFSEIDL